jgi:hypothetical protein
MTVGADRASYGSEKLQTLEFRDVEREHETIEFGIPWEPPAWRSTLSPDVGRPKPAIRLSSHQSIPDG